MPRALLIALLWSLLLVTGVAAQDATTEQALPLDQTAYVRIAQFSSDPLLLDVYLDGELVEGNLDYPTVTEWMSVPAGAHSLTATPAGAPETDIILGPGELVLQPMTWTTVAIVGSLSYGGLQTAAVPESTDDLLPGTSRVTFFNALAGDEPMAFYRNERPFVTSIDVGNAFSEEMDVDTYLLQVVTQGQSPQVLAELTDTILLENHNYLVAAVGVPGTAGEEAPQLVTAETLRGDILVGLGRLPAPGTVVQAVATENLTGDLPLLITSAGLVEELEGEGPFTVFAPAEFRIADLGEMTPEEQAAFLRGHIVEGEYYSQHLADGGPLETLDGGLLSLDVDDNGFSVNGARVLTVNIPATNGVVHLIGQPLVTAGG